MAERRRRFNGRSRRCASTDPGPRRPSICSSAPDGQATPPAAAAAPAARDLGGHALPLDRARGIATRARCATCGSSSLTSDSCSPAQPWSDDTAGGRRGPCSARSCIDLMVASRELTVTADRTWPTAAGGNSGVPFSPTVSPIHELFQIAQGDMHFWIEVRWHR